SSSFTRCPLLISSTGSSTPPLHRHHPCPKSLEGILERTACNVHTHTHTHTKTHSQSHTHTHIHTHVRTTTHARALVSQTGRPRPKHSVRSLINTHPNL